MAEEKKPFKGGNIGSLIDLKAEYLNRKRDAKRISAAPSGAEVCFLRILEEFQSPRSASLVFLRLPNKKRLQRLRSLNVVLKESVIMRI